MHNSFLSCPGFNQTFYGKWETWDIQIFQDSGFWSVQCPHCSTKSHFFCFMSIFWGYLEVFSESVGPFIFRQILLIIGLLNHQKDFAVSFACQLLYTCKLKQRLHDTASISLMLSFRLKRKGNKSKTKLSLLVWSCLSLAIHTWGGHCYHLPLFWTPVAM